MIRKFRELKERDSGVAMVWLATTVVLLLGTAGFAVDLGWLYLNASRVQRTADSAAMAGVIHLPGFPASADLDARDAARANGYDVCDPGFTGCTDTLISTPITDSMLEVEIQTQVDSFFMAVLGFDSFDIARESTAQYVKPVPLGSPDRCFGRDPTSTYCADDPDGFWAAVSAPYTKRENGDPYSTRCFTPTGNAASCSSWNDEYARGGSYGGYYYAIEIPVTGYAYPDLTVRVYDAGFYGRPSDESTGDGKWSPGANDPWGTTTYSFHTVDSTPYDPTDNPAVPGCTYALTEGQWEAALRDKWATLCSLSGPLTPGIYIFHVETSVTGSGSNHYSIAATSTAPDQPRVYGINDISIWNNTANIGGSTNLYLVEVAAEHAGSKLELQFFDPGDAQADSWMRVHKPDGSGGFVVPTCDWESYDYSGTITNSGNEPCEWQTTDVSLADKRVFNNQWITAIIDIPDDYTCNPGSDGCFWYMELELSDPNERTVWRARVIGNPVRLVP